MKKYIGKGFGKILVINLQRGDLLLESITEQAMSEGIKYGVILSGIGTLEKAVYHRVTSVSFIPEEEHTTLEGPYELSAIQGLIIDGEPHLHFDFSDGVRTYSAHLEPGSIVLYAAEIVLAEIKGLDGISRIITEKKTPEYFIKEGGRKC